MQASPVWAIQSVGLARVLAAGKDRNQCELLPSSTPKCQRELPTASTNPALTAPPSIVKELGMVMEMVADERGNEIVAMVVARLQS